MSGRRGVRGSEWEARSPRRHPTGIYACIPRRLAQLDCAPPSPPPPAVKFWEVGQPGSTELEMAPGLFGDLGAPVRQNNLCFTQRGNTISGTQDGDLYIWSSGTVTGKIERAHKSEVIATCVCL